MKACHSFAEIEFSGFHRLQQNRASAIPSGPCMIKVLLISSFLHQPSIALDHHDQLATFYQSCWSRASFLAAEYFSALHFCWLSLSSLAKPRALWGIRANWCAWSYSMLLLTHHIFVRLFWIIRDASSPFRHSHFALLPLERSDAGLDHP